MRHKSRFLILVPCLLLAACDSTDSQDEFANDATRPPKGITETDATGAIVRDSSGVAVSEDTDDWRTAPFFVGRLVVDPAYPNPSRAGTTVTVPIRVFQFDDITGGLVLRAQVGDRPRLLSELIDASSPGAYIMQFSASQLEKAGLHRLFILDDFGEIVSYGDVLVEQG
jgi:hypothetical protein